MNAHETLILKTFKFCTLEMHYIFKHTIVIAMSSNHPTIGENQ